VTQAGTNVFDPEALPAGTDFRSVSLRLSEAFRQQGYKLLYLPERRKVLGKSGKRADKSPQETV